MKFMWFHLMPYQDLPDDFMTAHESVWVDVDRRLVLQAPFGICDTHEPLTNLWTQPPGAAVKLLCVDDENYRRMAVRPAEVAEVERKIVSDFLAGAGG